MRCSQCVAAGQSSRVHEGASVTTAMAYAVFYGEQGRRHWHDPNHTATTYRCSNGHEWSESRQDRCWCGWPQTQTQTPEA